MTAHEYLKSLPHLPYRQGMKGTHPSNGELFRWLDSGSVIINGKKPKPNDEIDFPITELVFFPSGDRVTML
jgi:hypothetical protein